MASAAARPAQLPPVETRTGDLPRGPGWEALVASDRPVLFRGATKDWPLVGASPRAAADMLVAAQSGDPVVVFRGTPEIAGRFFYNEALDGFNFTAAREPFAPVIEEMLAGMGDPAAPSLYIGSTDLARFFPRLDRANGLDLGAIHPMLTEHPGLGSIWIGNRTVASCHYDHSHNIAVCVAGARRFTLFPPDQIANLYPGPLDPTPGGQVVSMVDPAAPDFARHPRFAEALVHAQVAEMEAGDVLIYPAMWWHHVEALSDFNILVNYWWNAVPGFVDTAQTTLLHALLSLRDRPDSEKRAWQALFDYYVFGDAARPRAHLPDHAQGPLAPMSDGIARRLRALVQRKLQR